jgi:hypothetical protein
LCFYQVVFLAIFLQALAARYVERYAVKEKAGRVSLPMKEAVVAKVGSTECGVAGAMMKTSQALLDWAL